MAEQIVGAATRRKRRIDLARLDFKAELSSEDVRRFEADYDKVWGVRRRITMMSLTRSRMQLVQGFLEQESGSDVLFNLAEEITLYRDHLRSGLELAEAAVARVLAAGHAAAAIAPEDADWGSPRTARSKAN